MSDPAHSQPDNKLRCSVSSVVLSVDNYASEFLRVMNDLRNQQLLFDVAITDGQTHSISAHKLVLASCFPYFKACFSQPTKDGEKKSYALDRFSWDAIECMIDFAYTGQAAVSVDKVQDVLDLASFLGSESIVRECCKVIVSRIDNSNVIDVLALGATPGLSDLMAGARDFIVLHFDEVMALPEIEDLPIESLAAVFAADGISLLRNNILCEPEEQELVLCKILFRWIERDPTERLSAAVEVAMPQIRWSFLSTTSREYYRLQLATLAAKCDADKQETSSETYLAKFDTSVAVRHEPRYGGVVEEEYGTYGDWRYFPFYHNQQQAATNPLVFFYDAKPKPTYVQSMRVYVRMWDGRRVVGGLRIKYSNGNEHLYGGDQFESMIEEGFSLSLGERIVRIRGHAGWLVDELTFLTNAGRSFGPFGGDGGGAFCNPLIHEILKPGHYLANIRGAVMHTLHSSSCRPEDPPAVIGLQFVWCYLAHPQASGQE